MKTTRMLIAITLVTMSGCTDKKAPVAANFEDALNTSFLTSRKCIVFEEDMTAPRPQLDNAGFDVAVSTGLMTRTPAALSSNGQPQFIYVLTDKGKATKARVTMGTGMQRTGYLCSGKLVVEKITNFTEPAENQGMRQTQVSYITKLVDVPDWQKSPAAAKSFPYLQPAETRPGTTERQVLTLTNAGWRTREAM
jgi:hypothetical protein